MRDWEVRAGATLLVPSGPQGQHLFIVLNDPREFPNYGKAVCVVVVPLDSIKSEIRYDTTCELPAGLHPFITRPTFVNFSYARIEQVRHLLTMVDNGLCTPHVPIDDAVVARIKAGLAASPFTKREFKLLHI